MRVWQKMCQFLNLFSFSHELFMTIHFLSQLKLIQTLRVTLYKLHCCTCSPPNLQKKKRYGFLFSHLISRVLSFIFVSICIDVLFLLWVCFDVFGIFLVWIIKVLLKEKLVLYPIQNSQRKRHSWIYFIHD